MLHAKFHAYRTLGFGEDVLKSFTIYTGCFIICVTIKNCCGFFEYAKIYQRLTQPCSSHFQVLFYVLYDKF